MTDTLTRNIYVRLFNGIHDSIADTVPGQLLGALYDKTYMPALLLESGKAAYYDTTMDQNQSDVMPLPENYDTDNRLYVAVWANKKAYVQFSSPVHGNNKIVLLYGTDNDTEGTHAAFWTHQGRLSSVTVGVPATAQGGETTAIKVFMYEIPDLDDYESYFDKQIGLGTSGD